MAIGSSNPGLQFMYIGFYWIIENKTIACLFELWLDPMFSLFIPFFAKQYRISYE